MRTTRHYARAGDAHQRELFNGCGVVVLLNPEAARDPDNPRHEQALMRPPRRYSLSMLPVIRLVGNPRPESRTHAVARRLTTENTTALDAGVPREIDLATLGPRVLDIADPDVNAAILEAVAADVLVVASPTYKATYTALFEGFLDRIATGGRSRTRGRCCSPSAASRTTSSRSTCTSRRCCPRSA